MKNELNGLDRAFLVAALLGTAAAYSALYLFHIVLALKILSSVTSPVTHDWRETRKILRWDLRFFAIFFLWYALSFLWADNKMYAAMYCAYILFAALTVFYTAHACRSQSRLAAALNLILIVTSVEIFLSALEGMGIIRLPFSPYSPYLPYFGRQIDLSEIGVLAYDYVSTLPTGFFHNPNNLAAFMGLMLPFFVLHPKWVVRIVGSAAILYVVYMCGARVAFIACGLVIFISVFVWGGFSSRVTAMAGVSAAVMLGAGLLDVMRGSTNLRLAEVGGLGFAISDFWEGLAGDRLDQGGSATTRAALIRNGLYALQDSNGVGVGAGGSQTIQEHAVFRVGDLTSMHNFWVEILVEGGVLFALLLAVWYAAFLWRLLKIARFSSDDRIRYYAKALFTGFLGFILGGVGPSSVIYMLPMWMMVGVGLGVIRAEYIQRERGLSGQPVYQHYPPGLRVAEAGSFRQK